MTTWRFDAIGTRWEVETESALDAERRSEVERIVADFDATWSRFRPDSTVTRLSSAGGEALATADAAPMLEAFRELSAATAGAVNPLIGDSLAALGYDAEYSLHAGAPVPAPQEWTRTLTWNRERLRLASAAMIDVGALGKGRLVDLVTDALAGIDGALVVDAGGDMTVRGEARIALEHPFDPTRAIGVATVRDQALCASAINRRAWGDGLHHVLDARTGAPVTTWAATWAFAADAMHADAVATALFFDGGPELAHRWGVEWVRMSTSGRAERTPGAPVELFTTPRGRG
ncbi:thiamine biosynthesis lipoprotein [Microbacterium ginsengiterrae]|uniref:FAD:protein FMN transferase n=1 Tax=Microbacterium ginsengiterrae TaxID=546115 RepID=A0A7W9CAH0_9MICO|nr:FAD:protein FMN transferase [Microbacterium ginsengiterrae]MBB5741846.1 thiamine biosynthesis lipoprotein [Microbacterium ginsengiterrae]